MLQYHQNQKESHTFATRPCAASAPAQMMHLRVKESQMQKEDVLFRAAKATVMARILPSISLGPAMFSHIQRHVFFEASKLSSGRHCASKLMSSSMT